MSWGNKYKLPWDRLHADQIDAGAAEVMRKWPEITLERGPATADHVALYFMVPPALARANELRMRIRGPAELDALWRTSGVDGVTPLPVEIDFHRYAAMPEHYLEESIEVSFDTAFSANGLASATAGYILDAIATFYGV